LPEQFQPEGPQVIAHEPEEKVFSDEVAKVDLPTLKDQTDS
jgi:hypothetical protein